MVDNDGYEYLDESSISRHLKCSICGKPCINPVSIRCKTKQVLFCRRCIELWIDRNRSCPTCHQNLAVQNLIPITNGVVTDMLDDLPVRCLRCEQCPLRRGDFPEHKKKCCLSVNRSSLSSNLRHRRIETPNESDDDLDNENRQVKFEVNHQQTQTETFPNDDLLLTHRVNQQQERQIETPQNENRRINTQNNNQETQLERLPDIIQQMMTRMNQLESQLTTVQNENRQLTTRINQQDTQIERLQDKNQELATRITRQERQLERYENENENLIRRLNQEETRIETLQNENRRMQARINEQETQLRRLQTNEKQTVARMNRFETALATIQNEDHKLTIQMETLRSENQQMASRINQLEEQVRTLPSSLRTIIKTSEERPVNTKFSSWAKLTYQGPYQNLYPSVAILKDDKQLDDNKNEFRIFSGVYPSIPLSLVKTVKAKENLLEIPVIYGQNFTYKTLKKLPTGWIAEVNKQVDDNKAQLKSLFKPYTPIPLSLVRPVVVEKLESQVLTAFNMPPTTATLQYASNRLSMNNNQNQQQTQVEQPRQNNRQRRSRTEPSSSERNRTRQVNSLEEPRNLPRERERIDIQNTSTGTSRRRRRPRNHFLFRASSDYHDDTDSDRINIGDGRARTRSRSYNPSNNNDDCSTNYSTESADGDANENDIDQDICYDGINNSINRSPENDM